MALVLLAVISGCAALRPWRPGIGACPGPLVSTDAIEGDFLWRERVRYRAPEVEASFEFVVQKRGDELVLVGFSELGAKAFAVTQHGVETEAQSFLGPALPVSPLTALHDLHRARFAPRVPGEAAVTLAPDGCGYEVTFARLETRPLP